MKTTVQKISVIALALSTAGAFAQEPPRRGPGGPGGPGGRGGGGPRPEHLGASPLDLGEPGIAWYPKLEDGLAEAKRANKPILFMAAASQCGSVPGVF